MIDSIRNKYFKWVRSNWVLVIKNWDYLKLDLSFWEKDTRDYWIKIIAQ